MRLGEIYNCLVEHTWYDKFERTVDVVLKKALMAGLAGGLSDIEKRRWRRKYFAYFHDFSDKQDT